MSNIKQMKSLAYKVEDSFGEVYDNTVVAGAMGVSGFQQIATSEIEVTRAPEDLVTLYQNKSRVLDEDHASGRDNGGFTFKKNLDRALMKNHKIILGTSLGTLVPAIATKEVGQIDATGNKLTFTGDLSGFAVGDFVQFVSDDGVYYAINRLETATASEGDLEFEVCNDEKSRIDGKHGELHQVSYLRPSVPDMAKTYQFVVTYQDDSVEVFRGASIKGSFNITKEGKAEIDFEVQSAKVQSINEDTGVALTTLVNTPTAEEAQNPIIFNFQTSTVYDFKNSVYKTDFPYALDIQFGNTIEPIKKTGCLNNIGGWYIKPSITGTIDWERTPTNLVNFSKYFEGGKDTGGTDCKLFTSNKDFAFFSPYVKYTNQDAKSVDSYDSIHTMINVNSWVNSEPLIVLPQELA